MKVAAAVVALPLIVVLSSVAIAGETKTAAAPPQTAEPKTADPGTAGAKPGEKKSEEEEGFWKKHFRKVGEHFKEKFGKKEGEEGHDERDTQEEKKKGQGESENRARASRAGFPPIEPETYLRGLRPGGPPSREMVSESPTAGATRSYVRASDPLPTPDRPDLVPTYFFFKDRLFFIRIEVPPSRIDDVTESLYAKYGTPTGSKTASTLTLEWKLGEFRLLLTSGVHILIQLVYEPVAVEQRAAQKAGDEARTKKAQAEPHISGTKVKSKIATLSSEKVPDTGLALAREFNKRLADLTVTKDEKQSVLRLSFRITGQISYGCRLLVRLFDENGAYLTHFSTGSMMEIIPDIQEANGVGWHSFAFSVARRDLRDASTVEVGIDPHGLAPR